MTTIREQLDRAAQSCRWDPDACLDLLCGYVELVTLYADDHPRLASELSFSRFLEEVIGPTLVAEVERVDPPPPRVVAADTEVPQTLSGLITLTRAEWQAVACYFGPESMKHPAPGKPGHELLARDYLFSDGRVGRFRVCYSLPSSYGYCILLNADGTIRERTPPDYENPVNKTWKYDYQSKYQLHVQVLDEVSSANLPAGP